MSQNLTDGGCDVVSVVVAVDRRFVDGAASSCHHIDGVIAAATTDDRCTEKSVCGDDIIATACKDTALEQGSTSGHCDFIITCSSVELCCGAGESRRTVSAPSPPKIVVPWIVRRSNKSAASVPTVSELGELIRKFAIFEEEGLG